MMRRWGKLNVWGKEIVFKQYRVGLRLKGYVKIYIGKHKHIAERLRLTHICEYDYAMRRVRLHDFYGVEYTVIETRIVDLILYIRELAANRIAILLDGSKYCDNVIKKMCRWAKVIEQAEEIEMDELDYGVCKFAYYYEFLRCGEYVVFDENCEDIILIGHTKGKALIVDRKKFDEMMIKLMVKCL